MSDRLAKYGISLAPDTTTNKTKQDSIIDYMPTGKSKDRLSRYGISVSNEAPKPTTTVVDETSPIHNEASNPLIDLGTTTAQKAGHLLGLPQRLMTQGLVEVSQATGGYIPGVRGMIRLPDSIQDTIENDLPENSKQGFRDKNWKEVMFEHTGTYPSDIVRAYSVDRYERLHPEDEDGASKTRGFISGAAGLLADITADPLNLLGFGMASAGRKATTQAAKMSRKFRNPEFKFETVTLKPKSPDDLRRLLSPDGFSDPKGPWAGKNIFNEFTPVQRDEALKFADDWEQAERAYRGTAGKLTSDEMVRLQGEAERAYDAQRLRNEFYENKAQQIRLADEQSFLRQQLKEYKQSNPELFADEIAETQKRIDDIQGEIGNLASTQAEVAAALKIHDQADMFFGQKHHTQAKKEYQDAVKKADTEEVTTQLGHKRFRRAVLDEERIPISARVPLFVEDKPLFGWDWQKKLFGKPNKEFTIPRKPEKPSAAEYIGSVGSRGRAKKTYIYSKDGHDVRLYDIEDSVQAAKGSVDDMTSELKESLLASKDVNDSPVTRAMIVDALETGNTSRLAALNDKTIKKAVDTYLDRMKALAENRGVPTHLLSEGWVPGELRTATQAGKASMSNLPNTALTARELENLADILESVYGRALVRSGDDFAEGIATLRAKITDPKWEQGARNIQLPELLKSIGLTLDKTIVNRLVERPILKVRTPIRNARTKGQVIQQARELGIPVSSANPASGKLERIAELLSDSHVNTRDLNDYYRQVMDIEAYTEDLNVVLNSIRRVLKDDIVNRDVYAKAIRTSMAREVDDALGHMNIKQVHDEGQLKQLINNDRPYITGDRITEGKVILYDFDTRTVINEVKVEDALKQLRNNNMNPSEGLFYVPSEDAFRLNGVRDRLKETLQYTAGENLVLRPLTYSFKNWIMSMPGPMVRNLAGDLHLASQAGLMLGTPSWNKAIRIAIRELDEGTGKLLQEAQALNVVGSGRRGIAELGEDSRLIGRTPELTLKQKAAKAGRAGLRTMLDTAPRKIGEVTERATTVGMRATSFMNPFKLAGHDPSRVIRLASYSYLRNKGWAPNRAATFIRKQLIDYGAVTRTEERWLKQLVPFYTWLRYGNTRSAMNMGHLPSAYNKPLALQRALDRRGEDSIDRGDLSDQSRYGESIRLFDLDGNPNFPTYMRLTNWSPQGSLMELANAILPDREVDEKVYEQSKGERVYGDIERATQGVQQTIAGGLHPGFKALWSAAYNSQAAPFGSWEVERYRGQPSPEHIAPLNRNLRFALNQLPPYALAERTWKRAVPRTDRVTGEETGIDLGAIAMTGAGFTPVMENPMANRYYRVLDLLSYRNDLVRDLKAATIAGDDARVARIEPIIAKLEDMINTYPVPPDYVGE